MNTHNFYKDTHIAGVTFCNNAVDGGESRQELLKDLIGRPTVVNLKKTIFHNPDTNQDELAIKIISQVSGKVLGFIPRDDIEKFVNISQMILQVSYYKNNYSGCLTMMTPPTPKQYGVMKSKLQKKQIKKLPVYDRLMYQYAIANS